MTNVGLFNEDLNFWFVFFLSLPVIIAILIGMLSCLITAMGTFAPAIAQSVCFCRELLEASTPPKEKIVYKDRPARTLVYPLSGSYLSKDPPKTTKTSTKINTKTSIKTSTKKEKVAKKKEDSGREIAKRKIKDDVVSCLKSLGIHKKDAISLVDQIMAKKHHSDVDSLLNACLDAMRPR